MLKLKNVNKHYGKKHALQDFSFTFENGIYTLLGPNGAGKTTLMNIITNNLSCDNSSSVKYNHQSIKKLDVNYLEKVGYMPQHQGLYEDFTASRFMAYIAALKGLSSKEANEQIPKLLDKVELLDLADKKIKGFSGGMKQRLLVAQALLGDPEIVVLDEPTAGLDPKQRVVIRNLISDYAKNADKTIIISTHIISDIESIAKAILIMKSGKLIIHGSVESLIEKLDDTEEKSLEQVYMSYFN